MASNLTRFDSFAEIALQSIRSAGRDCQGFARGIEAAQAAAKYNDGILEWTLPKKF